MTTLRVTVTCETCGHRMRMERRLTEAETFALVCHACEDVLTVVCTETDFLPEQSAPSPPRAFRTVLR